MKKDNVRDYATEAFRFYAREGPLKKYQENLKKEICERIGKEEGTKSGISKPTEAQIIKVEAEMELYQAEFTDLLAVENTIKRIDTSDLRFKDKIWPVVEAVYMANADKPIERGDIQNRVIKCDIDYSISPATSYRCLSMARYIFAVERGLRVEK